jgi:tripeptide aminopeptidase
VRIAALDWSGDQRGGGRTRIWTALAADGRLTQLVNGRSREQIAEDLIALGGESPDLVIGLDFAFSMPEWFVREKGAASGREFWGIAAAEGEGWLTSTEPPFFGRHKGSKAPPADRRFRRTEVENTGPGSAPKSVFQVGGGGAVGTGSIRGMALLARLAEAGLRIWPFDDYVPGVPLVVEIYPRLLTGALVKSSAAARVAYLKDFTRQMASPDLLAIASSSEDAFDAVVSAVIMERFRDEFAALPPTDALDRIEGRIWRPAGASSYAPPMPNFTSPLAESLSAEALERFERYVRVDSQAARDADGSPSTPGQLELGRLLVAELGQLGITDAALSDDGFVFATLPAVGEAPMPTVGLIAHMDVSPDAPAAGVEPLVHRDYDGGVIELPRGGTVLDPAAMPALVGKAGEDIVSSSGDTLLGADDKAGIAEIMTAVAYLAAHPELPRPNLRIAFTPDEEIGKGAFRFDIEAFGATCAYTIDGSTLGELQDETFTAAEAIIDIEGVDVHPGFATGKLVNAARLAARIVAELPADGLSPETTEGREGFIHVYEMSGSAASAQIRAIVRDFDDDLLAQHAELLREIAERVVGEEPTARVTVEVTAQYPNMRTYLEPMPEIVEIAERALAAEGLTPIRNPIRGGTDGSILSSRGLPTPNLFAGGHEFHSVREWISAQDMAAAAAVIVHLAGEWGRLGTPTA